MVGVFAISDMSMFQQMGFGLTAAVFIDPTLVRSVLALASMMLLGDKNWDFQSWLPRLVVEGESTDAVDTPNSRLAFSYEVVVATSH